MATVTITGTLSDFGLDSLDAYNPSLVFTPSSPATTPDGQLLATRPITVTPDAAGAFTVDLVASSTTFPETYYLITVEWLDSPSGFTAKDFPGWRFYAPAGGGEIGDVGWAPSNPALAYFSTSEPPGSNFTDGTWWLDADMADPASVEASGILYEWSS